MTTKKKTTASQLIANRQKNGPNSLPAPSAQALKELRTIVEHNDTCDRTCRVTVEATIEMLREHGWSGRSRHTLNSVCAKHLGRSSFAQP